MKRYRKTGGGILGAIDKMAKPLGVIAVAALILGAYSWAAADDIQTQTAQANEYEQVKAEYIAKQEIEAYEGINQSVNSDTSASYEQVSETLENAEIETLSAEICEDSANNDAIWEDLGTFKVTAYCGGECCCGVWADEECTTASGEKAVEGITVAADTDILPLGTTIRINGQEYTVQDTGSAVKGNVIDVFYNDHQTAVQHGVQYLTVEVKR